MFMVMGNCVSGSQNKKKKNKLFLVETDLRDLGSCYLIYCVTRISLLHIELDARVIQKLIPQFKQNKSGLLCGCREFCVKIYIVLLLN